MQPTHVYEVLPRKDHRVVDLISDWVSRATLNVAARALPMVSSKRV
jgi:hypothetical protein